MTIYLSCLQVYTAVYVIYIRVHVYVYMCVCVFMLISSNCLFRVGPSTDVLTVKLVPGVSLLSAYLFEFSIFIYYIPNFVSNRRDPHPLVELRFMGLCRDASEILRPCQIKPCQGVFVWSKSEIGRWIRL